MERNKTRLWVYGLLTLIVMVGIFYMSAKDGTESSNMSEWLLHTPIGNLLMKLLPGLTDYGAELDIRKYAHMAEYALLAVFAVCFFTELLLERIPRRAALICTVFCFLYACSDEYHQLFVPGRSGQFTDVLVDMAGVLPGIVIVFFSRLIRKEQK